MTYWEWFSATVKRVISSEKTCFDDTYGYAGTPDLVAELNDGTTALIDKKSGMVGINANIQVSVYSYFIEIALKINRRLILPIDKKGKKHKVIEILDREAIEHYTAFLSMVTLYDYKIKNGIIKE